MSWIRILSPEGSTGPLHEAHEKVGRTRGTVANIPGIHSVAPAVMTGHLDLYREIMFSRFELSRAARELVATAVSPANECHY